MIKLKELIGKHFGKLTVIGYDKRTKGKHFWKCKCDCGNETVINESNLIYSKNPTCGCSKKNTGKNSLRYSGYEEITGSQYGWIKIGAKKRNLVFDVSLKYLWELFLKQGRKCALSNLMLTFPQSRFDYTGTASLDRIDSTKGYVEGNVQWVHKKINVMKQDLNEEEFIQLCEGVVNHHRANPAA